MDGKVALVSTEVDDHWYANSHLGQLSHLPSAVWEMSTS